MIEVRVITPNLTGQTLVTYWSKVWVGRRRHSARAGRLPNTGRKRVENGSDGDQKYGSNTGQKYWSNESCGCRGGCAPGKCTGQNAGQNAGQILIKYWGQTGIEVKAWRLRRAHFLPVFDQYRRKTQDRSRRHFQEQTRRAVFDQYLTICPGGV